jgi:hypothetical protein
MKKFFSLSVFLFALCAMSQAQFTEVDMREQLSVGVKAGLNISNVWDKQTQDFQADAKAGFAGGIFISIPIGMYLGFQPEVQLSQKGYRASGTLFSAPYSFTRTSTYVDVPLLVQIKPARFLAVLVGPQYSYLVHQKNAYAVGDANFVQQDAIDNENIRKNILGVVGGLDITLSHLVIAPRIGWDLLNNNGDGSSTTPRYKNRWVQLTVGVRI